MKNKNKDTGPIDPIKYWSQTMDSTTKNRIEEEIKIKRNIIKKKLVINIFFSFFSKKN